MTMTQTVELQVGESTISLKLPESVILPTTFKAIQNRKGWSDAEILESVSLALSHPIDYPPLEECIIDGDQVAIAVCPFVPGGERLVAAVVNRVLEQRVPPEHIQVVLAEELEPVRDLYAQSLARLGIEASRVLVHHSRDQDSLAYLAADEDAEPIYVNRVLLDADIVLPLVAGRDENVFAYSGLSGIVPYFLGSSCQKNWRRTATHDAEEARFKRLERARQVGMWVGITMVVCASPRVEGYQVLAGLVDSIEQQIGDRTYEPRGSNELGMSGETQWDTLVASIDGGQEYQSWDFLARAVYELSHSLIDHGTLVICSEIAHRPDGALRFLCGTDEEERTETRILKSELPHALASLALLEPLKRIRFYLYSKCHREAIEELGIGYIGKPSELETLLASSKRGMVVPCLTTALNSKMEVEKMSLDSRQP